MDAHVLAIVWVSVCPHDAPSKHRMVRSWLRSVGSTTVVYVRFRADCHYLLASVDFILRNGQDFFAEFNEPRARTLSGETGSGGSPLI
jgi:hypothetical protein